jgi:pentatricopeptide repeat protein
MERSEVVRLNNEIARLAGRRDANAAEMIFLNLRELGVANTHSFASMINAYVQCGDIVKAADLLDQLKMDKRLKLDIVSCTSLMKGYSKNGNIPASMQLLKDMDIAKPKVIPNIRTLNTFLRGCIVAGAVSEATQVFTDITKTHKLSADVSSWEYLVTLLSQSLCVDKIHPIIGRLGSDVEMLSGLGLMYLNLARACALLGDIKAGTKAVRAARESLDKNEAAELANGDCGYKEDEERVVSGGKRSWRQQEDNSSRDQSLQVTVTSHTSLELTTRDFHHHSLRSIAFIDQPNYVASLVI